MRSLAEARIKRARAVELAAEGRSYDEIAQAVGYSHRGSAHRAVFKAITEREVEDVDHLRALEMDRLDVLLRALWPRVEDGDLAAINTAIRITETRIKLLGLDRRGASRDEFAALVVGGPAVC